MLIILCQDRPCATKTFHRKGSYRSGRSSYKLGASMLLRLLRSRQLNLNLGAQRHDHWAPLQRDPQRDAQRRTRKHTWNSYALTSRTDSALLLDWQRNRTARAKSLRFVSIQWRFAPLTERTFHEIVIAHPDYSLGMVFERDPEKLRDDGKACVRTVRNQPYVKSDIFVRPPRVRLTLKSLPPKVQ